MRGSDFVVVNSLRYVKNCLTLLNSRAFSAPWTAVMCFILKGPGCQIGYSRSRCFMSRSYTHRTDYFKSEFTDLETCDVP